MFRINRRFGTWILCVTGNLTITEAGDNDEFFAYSEISTGNSGTSNRGHLFIKAGTLINHGWRFTTTTSLDDYTFTPRLNDSPINGVITILAGVPATYIADINVPYAIGDLFNSQMEGMSAGTTSINRGRTCCGSSL